MYKELLYARSAIVLLIKVPIIPKYFFRLTKSLHLFETHCAFLLLFNPNIDLLQAVKVTKSGHHLSHDRASKGYGSTPCLTSQTALHACLQRLNTMLFVFTYVSFPVFFYANMIVNKNEVLNKVKLMQISL